MSDEDLAMALAYGAAASATDRGAKRISYLVDENGNVARAYGKVKAAEHPEQVLTDLA